MVVCKKTSYVPCFLQLVEGYAHYGVSGVNGTFAFDYLPVNDGKWHYLEIRWPKVGEIILVMDYGYWQVSLHFYHEETDSSFLFFFLFSF